MNLFKEQIALEESAINTAVRKYSKSLLDPSAKLPAEFAFLKKVMPPYIKAIKEYQLPGRGKKNTLVRETICAIKEPSDMAYLVLNTVISSCMGKQTQMPLQKLCVLVGADLIDHVDYLKFAEYCRVNELKDLKWAQLQTQTAPAWKRQAIIAQTAKKVGYNGLPSELERKRVMSIPVEQFTELDSFKVGAEALDLLLTSTKMFSFEKGLSSKKNECMYLKPSPETETWLNDLHTLSAIARPRYLPCVIEPKPWNNLMEGGYYIKRGKSALKLLRVRHTLSFKENSHQDLSEVFNALNTIQNTPWRINTKVLEIIKQTDLLPSEEDVEIPEPLADTSYDYARLRIQMPKTLARRAKERAKAFEKRASITSKAFAAKQCVEIAEQMQKYEKFYFPCNLDYRGRVYPVPSYLNPQGHDVAKGLLEFAEGKELGNNGARWLAIHGANCYGNNVDKLAFDARYEWVKANTQAILKSASEPLKSAFWHDAEDRFQFLAFCFEWKEYLEQGEKFVSHLSVSMDGSCNGLQHLSAILKDAQGGKLVNLLKTSIPSDVYSIVKDSTSETVEKEAANGDEVAKAWCGLVDRKIVKRPVMTQGYGVTMSGIKNQIKFEVHKRDGEYLTIQNKHTYVDYLATVISGSIKELMPGVAEVKDWLREIASLFSEANLPIKWTTPTGLKVVQQKFKQKQVRVRSFYGTAKLKGFAADGSLLTMNVDTDKLDKVEQMNALVPNVIHSLDAAHLMKTVNACTSIGITSFHAIHDSYGTHAANVETLHRIIREEFVALYKGDYLRSLSQQFIEQLPVELQERAKQAEETILSKMGSLDLNSVLEAQYFFA